MNLNELYVIVRNAYGESNADYSELLSDDVFTLKEIKDKKIKTFKEMSNMKYEANKKKIKYVAITLKDWGDYMCDKGYVCAYG